VNRNLKIGIVGTGPMAALHAATLQHVPGVELIWCASRDKDKASAFSRAHHIGTSRTIEEAMIKADADAIWISVAASAMADTARQFAALGLPLFLEKPVGLSLEETKAATAAISSPNMVGLNRRFYEVVHCGLKQLSEAGQLRAIEVHMPEDVSRLPDKHSGLVRRQWQYANSIHLIDLFRFFAGEATQVIRQNKVSNDVDRSYMSLLRFSNGARGIFNAQWYAPGGWRVCLYADDIMLQFQPIEELTIRRRGQPAQVITATGPDKRFKPGLYNQALAFAALVRTGTLPYGAADLKDYARTVELTEKLTNSDSELIVLDATDIQSSVDT
jgi:predicted dehydrogenase